jgi:methionine-S-sulfoxide reductase
MPTYNKNPDAVSRLSPEQYRITQTNGTERPFDNAYWDNKEPGIYVDVVSGEPLFASINKFDSHTGWPSFTKPIERENVVENTDISHGMTRQKFGQAMATVILGTCFPMAHAQEGGLAIALTQPRCASFISMNSRARATAPIASYSRLKKRRNNMSTSTERAILAGGCFWGVQDLLRRYPGVISTRVGYSGGDVPNATYRNHGTHAEAIEIIFDPDKLSYRALLEFFFQIHDPTTLNRQGNDRGTSYRSAIFYTSDEQKRIASDTIADVDASGIWPGKVVTEVAPAGAFWEAEPEHQDYLEHYPNGYTCHFIRPNWRLPRRHEKTSLAS